MKLLTIGKIAGTHHLKGAVKVIANINDVSILLDNKVVIENNENHQRILSVKNVSKLVENKWIVEFKEITNKTDAGLLNGNFIKIKRDLLDIQEDEYLLNDLLDMQVVDVDKNELLGNVVDIFETAAHDILVVESPKYEIMIPHIDEFVKKIDFEKREIYVILIEGMKNNKGEKFEQIDGFE